MVPHIVGNGRWKSAWRTTFIKEAENMRMQKQKETESANTASKLSCTSSWYYIAASLLLFVEVHAV